MSGDDYENPFGVSSEEEGDDTVTISVVFLGLKKKLFGGGASNGKVEFKLQEVPGQKNLANGFTLLLEMKDKDTTRKYRYQVKKLPAEVLADASKYKVQKDDVVQIKLKKAKAESWAKTMSEYGIDVYESESSESEKSDEDKKDENPMQI